MIYVPVHELSRVWPVVRQLMARAIDKFGERVTPEELYYALRQNMASLYMSDRGMVAAQKIVELDGTVSLFVLVAAGEMAEESTQWLQKLEKLASEIGAVRVKMASPRKGWEKALNGYWSVSHVVYEHDLRIVQSKVA